MRPPRMELMISMAPPPCNSLCSSNQADRPSSVELSTVCNSLPSAPMPPATSEASACRCSISRCLSSQRLSVLRSMPIDSITSALRKVLSAYCCAPMAT